MPVGTCGSVKGLHFSELREQVKAQIILGNTYHLYLRPGLDTLQKAGGLHKFNTWDRPILTDSGGFQVFSLTGIRKLKEEGCEFRSHIDGSKHFFTPENVMDTERIIGADIMMAFDECPPGESDYQYAKKSLGLTQRWLDRCVKRFNETEPLYGYEQSLFPIVQGCTFKDLRREAAKYIADNISDRECPIAKQSRLRPLPEYEATHYRFRYTDIDFNRHVNSCRYIDVLLNQWPLDFHDNHRIARFEIAYMKEAYFGDEVEVRSHTDGNETTAEIINGNEALCRARFIFTDEHYQ